MSKSYTDELVFNRAIAAGLDDEDLGLLDACLEGSCPNCRAEVYPDELASNAVYACDGCGLIFEFPVEV